jgi:hypothetical protein
MFAQRMVIDKRRYPARLAIAISSAMLFSIVDVSATETTWNVLERFGLMGTWSTQCQKPATPKAFRTIFAKGADGIALREIDYGAGYPIRRTLVQHAQLWPITAKIISTGIATVLAIKTTAISSWLTLAPSLRVLKPAFSTAEMCTNTSLPPLSG